MDEQDEYLWVSRAGFAKTVDGHDCDRGRRNVATRSAAVSLSPVQLVRPDEERSRCPGFVHALSACPLMERTKAAAPAGVWGVGRGRDVGSIVGVGVVLGEELAALESEALVASLPPHPARQLGRRRRNSHHGG